MQEKHLLTLPARANLQVIPTPEFMRGSYPVGGFNPAPALEPQLGAFYWVTPIPATWPKERVESKLREYNFYKLKLLTIHEAMPGHYVQIEVANDVQPQCAPPAALRLRQRPVHRRLGPVFHADDAGRRLSEPFAGTGADLRQGGVARPGQRDPRCPPADAQHDRPGGAGPDEKQTFQEQEEATAKLQRAKLTSAQLPMYYVGWRALDEGPRRVQAGQGQRLQPADFNDRALKEGAVPLLALRALLK